MSETIATRRKPTAPPAAVASAPHAGGVRSTARAFVSREGNAPATTAVGS
ncbi:hypothetical protein [Streptomyces sp. NPDC048584]